MLTGGSSASMLYKKISLRKNLNYLKLKKKFKINWKAAATAHKKSIENIVSADKIFFNQLANRCQRQIKIVNRKFTS